MSALLALIPILVVLLCMLLLRWSSPLAGLAGWCVTLLVGALAFGLNWPVFWVSQAKGLLLTWNVLYMLWPAIFLYNLVENCGGIRAIAAALQRSVSERGWLLLLQAWMLSAIIESLAGFGLPIAMVAPLLIGMGVEPVQAVAAVAVGHTWAGSTGGMALSLRLLSEISHYSPEALFPPSALLLGISILLSGFGTAFILGEKKHWLRILLTGLVAALVQYFAGRFGLLSVCAILGSVIGFVTGIALNRRRKSERTPAASDPALWTGLIAYGLLTLIMLSIAVLPALNQALSHLTWTLQFPTVTTASGFATPAESGYLFHIFTHPGTLILLTIALFLLILLLAARLPRPNIGKAWKATLRSGVPASFGTLFMIGLSTAMEHTGMTNALATTLSSLVGGIYPLFAPIIGVVGSFATGSNVNSNVLFGLLQKQVAIIVGASPLVVLAGQTTGGSLGSSIAPVKLAIGTSTNAAKGKEGEVLRRTLPVCLIISLIIGVVTWLLA